MRQQAGIKEENSTEQQNKMKVANNSSPERQCACQGYLRNTG